MGKLKERVETFFTVSRQATRPMSASNESEANTNFGELFSYESVDNVTTRTRTIQTQPQAQDLLFIHEPLRDTTKSILTFQIESFAQGNDLMSITLTNHRLKSSSGIGSMSYVALSYEWGAPDTLRQILVNGKLFAIRSNL